MRFFSARLNSIVEFHRIEILGLGWYSRPELNGDTRFRKPLLYPFELRERRPPQYRARNGTEQTLRQLCNCELVPAGR